MHPADAPGVPHEDAETPPPASAEVRGPGPRGHPPPSGAPSTSAGATAPALSEREGEILAFEKQWWKHAGAKEQAIRDTFGLSATRYYQLLNALLDKPAAMERDPVLVARLRRLRWARARTRRR